jgi:glycosyltransferase involved in cell wall biosynthesis
MRILHITNSLSDRGNGIVNLALDLAIEQHKAGHHPAFASGPGGHEQILHRFSIPWFPADLSQSPRRLPASLLHLRSILRRFRPDIIHAHTRAGLLYAWALSRVPHVPLVGHLHNIHDSNLRLLGFADRVIAVSHSAAQTLVGLGVSRSKVRVILNGSLGSARVPAIASLAPRRLARPAIVTVAGMNERKGIAELLIAFDRIAPEFPEAHLYLVGHGPERERFERQAAECASTERIHFEGFQPVPQEFLLSADIFVLASRREAFGLAITEAREAGCAIIATSVDGIPEALDGGQAGILVPPNNPDELAAAMRRLLQDPALSADLRRRAQAGTARYTTARMAQETLALYGELIPRSADTAAAPLPRELQQNDAVRHL